MPKPICFRLLTALMRWALDLALLKAGNIIAARMARIANTSTTATAPWNPRRRAAPINTSNTATTMQKTMNPAWRSMRTP